MIAFTLLGALIGKYPITEAQRKLLCICLIALCCFGCRAEKAQDIRPAERVEPLVQDEHDPRPYFHAELKFANADQVKLPGRAEELQKRSEVREASSLFIREGRDFIPFKVSNRGQRASWT